MSTLSTIANGATGAAARAAINAAIGWLNSQKVTGSVAWVDTNNGDDDTGEVGNPSRPYETVAAAYAATIGAAGLKTIFLCPGYHSLISPAANITGSFVGHNVESTSLYVSVSGEAVAPNGGAAGSIDIRIEGLTLSADLVGGAGWIEGEFLEASGGAGGNLAVSGHGNVSFSVNGGAATGDGTTTGGAAGQASLKGVTVLAAGAVGGAGAGPGMSGNIYMDDCDASACTWDIAGASMHFGRTSYSSSAATELAALYTDRGGNANNY